MVAYLWHRGDSRWGGVEMGVLVCPNEDGFGLLLFFLKVEHHVIDIFQP